MNANGGAGIVMVNGAKSGHSRFMNISKAFRKCHVGLTIPKLAGFDQTMEMISKESGERGADLCEAE